MPDASKGVVACCKGVLKNGFREHSDGCPLGEAVKALKFPACRRNLKNGVQPQERRKS